MHLTRYLDDVVAWAPAKVNLYLEVLAKRPDGYHALETVMVTAGLFDTPAAWCTGRGEIVTPAAVGGPFELVLLCPAFGLPTAQVYRQVVVPAQPQDGTAIRAALARGDVAEVGRCLFNRLQDAAVHL